VESDDEDPLDMSRSLRYHLEETDMTTKNDPGDLDSDYTPEEHQEANEKTEDQLAKKAGKENG